MEMTIQKVKILLCIFSSAIAKDRWKEEDEETTSSPEDYRCKIISFISHGLQYHNNKMLLNLCHAMPSSSFVARQLYPKDQRQKRENKVRYFLLFFYRKQIKDYPIV